MHLGTRDAGGLVVALVSVQLGAGAVILFYAVCMLRCCRCILDGEMLVWDSYRMQFVEFGSNQTAGADGARKGMRGSDPPVSSTYAGPSYYRPTVTVQFSPGSSDVASYDRDEPSFPPCVSSRFLAASFLSVCIFKGWVRCLLALVLTAMQVYDAL